MFAVLSGQREANVGRRGALERFAASHLQVVIPEQAEGVLADRPVFGICRTALWRAYGVAAPGKTHIGRQSEKKN
jgi:hypothetical protein